MKKMVFTFLLIVIFLYSLIFIINAQEPITDGGFEKALLEINAEIPRQFMSIKPGEELWVKVSIYNIETTESVDVLITYQIKDLEGNILLGGSETLGVTKQRDYVKMFVIPEEAKEGKYMLYATITYNGSTASSTVEFVINRILKTFEIVTFFSIVIILIIIIIMLNQTRKIKEHVLRHHKKIHKEHFRSKKDIDG